ncbi:hypothetical protein BH11GEM1_BH11GEM1_21310 [soil metagenome]
MDMPAEKPRLLTQVNGRMRARHVSPRTVQVYVGWIIRYIRYHGTRHPSELGETEIIAYLTYQAAERRVSRPTQMQALSALMLLYRENVASTRRRFAPGVTVQFADAAACRVESRGGCSLRSLLFDSPAGELWRYATTRLLRRASDGPTL